MNFITYKGKTYPSYETTGHSSRFIIPFAKEYCTGTGFDIGCNRLEWALPGSIPVDINFNNGFDAYNLPNTHVDYIFSSHCLEHLQDWVKALDYWTSKIDLNGTIFLYLPHYDQEYWRPWNNRKHLHVLTKDILKDYFKDRNYSRVITSEVDLNHSFSCIGIK